MSNIFERTPQDYTDYMDQYFDGMQRMHDGHEAALGRMVSVNEIATGSYIPHDGFAAQNDPEALPYLLGQYGADVTHRAGEHARESYNAVEEASFVLRAIATASDRQVYDSALDAFRSGNRTNAFKYIDANASNEAARRALRTGMDIGVAARVRDSSRILQSRGEITDVSAYAANIKSHVKNYASATQTQAPIRGIGFKDVARTMLWLPRLGDMAGLGDFIDVAAHSPEANDVLYTLRDVMMIKHVDSLINRGYYSDQPYNLIDKVASNDTIRKAAYAYTKQAFARQERDNRRREQQRSEREQQDRDRQEQRRQQAEQDRQERARRQQRTTQNTATTPPRQENKRVNQRVLATDERATVATAIAGVKHSDYKVSDRLKRALKGEQPADIMDVIDKVNRLRKGALAKGEPALTDKKIYTAFRQAIEVKTPDPLDQIHFTIVANLMGGEYKGKLPF